MSELTRQWEEIEEQKALVRTLRRVLSFYAEESNWKMRTEWSGVVGEPNHKPPMAHDDGGHLARAALSGLPA